MCLHAPSPYPSHCAYRSPGPPEVQVHTLACLVEMSLHILFPKSQECVHADIEATLRLLQGTMRMGKQRDEACTCGKPRIKGQKGFAS